MKIEKLPSGSYRIRKTRKGKTYTLVLSHRPGAKEADELMERHIHHEQISDQDLTFHDAFESYVKAKSAVLSPSTIRGYYTEERKLPEDFKSLFLAQIDQIRVQQVINDLSPGYAPKYIRNLHGLISAVLGMFRPELVLHTTLPQKRKSEPYIPTDNEVLQLAEAAKGTMFECAFLLGCYGLRRSETCCITSADLSGNLLSIDKAYLLDKDGEWIIRRNTKTVSSTRTIYIDDYLRDRILEEERAYKGNPNDIVRWMNREQDRLGIPRFSYHKLRHYYATIMSEYFPEADVLKSGGWSTPYVMKATYRHSRVAQDQERQKKMSDTLAKRIMPQ